ncbi:MAG: hypothetical protein EBS92_05715, partial [Proteobacteria bacterium]|nr:hypothetical protein [Pseudomonadota bacterium]
VQVFAKSGSMASSPGSSPRASSPSRGPGSERSSQSRGPGLERSSSQQPVVVSTQPGPTSFHGGRQGRRPQRPGSKEREPQERGPQGRGSR